MARAINPYGNGHAAERIAAVLAGEEPAPFAAQAVGAWAMD
jgi:UDP-N-acetylglucosamine 2-epimerase